MADTKITNLTTGSTVHSDDWLVYVDTHDTTMAASGTDKKVSPSVLLAGLGAGTVTTVSVVSANGLAGTVANASTTPAITLSTTVTGLLKGNGTAISAAVSDTDYQAPISLTTTGSSGAATFSGNTLNIPQYSGGGGSGTVTSVSVVTANGLAGTVATATTTPAITLTTSVTGLVKGDGTALSAATAGTDYVIPSGSITGTAGGLSANIAESQVTNLVSDLAARLIAANNLSDLASASTARTNLGLGSLAVLSTLPNPSATTLGGIESAAAVSHQWIASISTSGVPSLSQPAFGDISGTISTAQIGASQVTYAKLQNETASTLLGNPTGSAAASSEITLGSGLSFSGTTLVCTASGSGTVTSVALSLPTFITVSGSPVTTSGTLTGTLATQAANAIFAGPATGSAAAPTFRALVSADLPSGTGTVTTVSVATANGFAGTVANPTTTPAITIETTVTGILLGNGTSVSAATAGTDYQAPITLTTTGSSGAATFISNTLNIPQYSGGSGTVTSVALALPSGVFGITGSPVTGAGTLTGSLVTQTANTVWAGPGSGAAATPTFRAVVPADLPVFVASGTSHAAGAVPDPGATSGSTRYLREDATWDVPSGGSSGPIYSQVADVTVTASGAASLVSTTGAAGSPSLAAGALNTAGNVLTLEAGGYVTTAGSGQGGVTMSVKLGSNVIAVTGNITFSASQANRPWACKIEIITKATGSSGTVECSGWFALQNTASTGAWAGFTTASSGAQAPQTPFPIDLTAAYAADFQVNLGTSANTFVLTKLILK